MRSRSPFSAGQYLPALDVPQVCGTHSSPCHNSTSLSGWEGRYRICLPCFRVRINPSLLLCPSGSQFAGCISLPDYQLTNLSLRSKHRKLYSHITRPFFPQAASCIFQQSNFLTRVYIRHIPGGDRLVIRSDRVAGLGAELYHPHEPHQSGSHGWSCLPRCVGLVLIY